LRRLGPRRLRGQAAWGWGACGVVRGGLLPGLGDIQEFAQFDYADAIADKGASLGPGTRFFQIRRLDQDKSTDAFLGLDKGPIAIDIPPTHIFSCVGEGAGVQKMAGRGHLVDPFANQPRLADMIFMGQVGPDLQVLPDKE
jgi:hypothetical protein